jgi:hypothetical protein
MANWHHRGGQSDDVESLVRAAGTFVRPSEDLRPRVLESARAESREQRARRHLWRLAVVVGLLGVVSTIFGSRLASSGPAANLVLEAAALTRHTQGDDAGWGLVDSFTELRRRQAALLRLTE